MAMQSIRKLNYNERIRLDKWLEADGITLNSRTRRDTYSDVGPVAEILQKIYTSIELGCYPAAGSFAIRLQNWTKFSMRELKKLGLRLKTEDLKQLAEGRTGAVDWLLFSVISKKEVRPIVRVAPKANFSGWMNRFGGLSLQESTFELDNDGKC